MHDERIYETKYDMKKKPNKAVYHHTSLSKSPQKGP